MVKKRENGIRQKMKCIKKNRIVLRLAFFMITVMVIPLYFSGCMKAQNTELPPEITHEPEMQEVPLPSFDTEMQDRAENPPVSFFKSDERYFYYIEAQLQKKKGNLSQAVLYLSKTIENDPNSIYLQKELANFYLRGNENENALKVLEEIIKKNPDNLESLIFYGNLKQRLKETDDAKKVYEKVLAADPKQRDIYLLLGSLYLEEENLDDAFRIYEQLVKNFPDAYEGHFFIGKIHSERGNLIGAEKEFKETLDMEPDLEEPQFELLEIYEAQGKKDKVIRIYEDMLDENPDNTRAAMGLAYFYRKTGMVSKSENLLKELGTKSVSDSEIIRELAQIYINTKKYEAATVILEGMLKGAPNDSGIHYAAGIAFDGLKQEGKAMMHFKAVKPDSDFYENAAVHISFLYQEQGKIEEAILFLQNVIKKVPDNSDFMLYLGSFYEEAEDFKNAEKTLKQGIETDSENPRLHFRLGVIYDKQGRKEDCIEAMKTVLRLAPEDADALNYLGYTYADLGKNLDEAERLVKEALKYKPNDGYITDSLGWVFFKKGLFDKAIKYLEKAAALVPDDPTILEHLGDAYLKAGNRTKALEAYKDSLSKKEKDTEAIEKKIRELSE